MFSYRLSMQNDRLINYIVILIDFMAIFNAWHRLIIPSKLKDILNAGMYPNFVFIIYSLIIIIQTVDFTYYL